VRQFDCKRVFPARGKPIRQHSTLRGFAAAIETFENNEHKTTPIEL
jgi:hypothetical protein